MKSKYSVKELCEGWPKTHLTPKSVYLSIEFVSVVNLTQTRVTWEEGTSFEISSIRMACECVSEIFSVLMIDAGGPTHHVWHLTWAGGPRLYKKKGVAI